MSQPPVLAIVVNWRQPEATLSCVEALEAMSYPDLQVLVIDSGSGDGSAQMLEAALGGIPVIAMPENLGFAAASNRGLRAARQQGFDWALLVNNDAVADPRMLARLAGEVSDDIALLGPKIFYRGSARRIWFAGGRQHPWLLETRESGRGEVDGPAWSESRDVEVLYGTCLLVNVAAVSRIGLLDERFFMYFEDLDWCMRLREAGYRLRLVAAAHLQHDVSLSSGGEGSSLHRYYLARASVLFFRRHASKGKPWAILLFRAISAVKMVAVLTLRGRLATAGAYLRGLRDGWRLAAQCRADDGKRWSSLKARGAP